jgi:hypothetical protein
MSSFGKTRHRQAKATRLANLNILRKTALALLRAAPGPRLSGKKKMTGPKRRFAAAMNPDYMFTDRSKSKRGSPVSPDVSHPIPRPKQAQQVVLRALLEDRAMARRHRTRHAGKMYHHKPHLVPNVFR